MKQLSKEQLTDLVFGKCEEIVIDNFEEFKQHMLNLSKETQDDGLKMIVNFVIAYGNEIRRECCKTIVEILYDVLYVE